LFAEKLEIWKDNLSKMPLGDIIAESLVLIDVVTKEVRGGFFLDETLGHVIQFAKSFFDPSK